MNILITGAAGFIAYHLINKLIIERKADKIIGIDNINDYYDINLKLLRLKNIETLVKKYSIEYNFIKEDITNKDTLISICQKYNPSHVIHLAAYAGVRYSLENPDAFIKSNIIGFYNVLESCIRLKKKPYLIYASSSSVYGKNTQTPIISPISLYAATKGTNEILAYYYNLQYKFPITGLRFFTVYGPFGRPDMALYKFIENFINNKTVEVYNYGNCYRDFTYIDDIVDGIIKSIEKPNIEHTVYNLGTGKSIKLSTVINIIQEELIRSKLVSKFHDFDSLKKLLPMQPGDVESSCADISETIQNLNYNPQIDIKTGIQKMIEWYREYKNL